MSSEMRKMVWSKLKLPFGIPGRHRKERSLNKLNVNEEYKALRTKSYIEMCRKVETQLGKHKLSSSSSSHPLYIHLSEYLLEPSQETLTQMFEHSNLDHLMFDYFQSSLEACNICELLLQGIHLTRANYPMIKGSNYQPHSIVKDLSSFAMLNNPLSTITQSQFRDMHETHNLLLQKLTLKYRKIQRRTKFMGFCKKIVGWSLIVSYGALVIALLVLAFHSIIGAIAGPGLIACSFGLFKKRMKLAKKGLKISSLEKLGQELDIAAKGVYILIKDFDTMGRLVGRLNDEMEHRKLIADFCSRNGRNDMVLNDVLRKFGIHECGFLEQLEELEEHIYLCFLTINRLRRLVLDEVMVFHSEI